MKLINLTPIFNLVNNGFCYLARADDGTYWIRSTSGNWAQVKTSEPMADLAILDADFQVFLKSGRTITENDVKVDNSSQIIVDPVKPPPPEVQPEPATPDEPTP